MPKATKAAEAAKAKNAGEPSAAMAAGRVKSLTSLLSTKTVFKNFAVWIIGDTPIITHAWSEKAKREMLQKQVKATRAGKEARDPDADFVSSIYEMGDGVYGFPATGVKNCILAAAHKDKGVARTSAQASIWIDAEMVRVRPAHAGAICDMPLIRIWGNEPEMREDMVKIGAGLKKTANLAYRAQFWPWAMRITGRFNPTMLKEEGLAFLIQESGFSSGLGEWRNERHGPFGAFRMADVDEEAAWEAFATGRGPLPVPASYREAAE